ncbi:cytidylyltransferase domain-containing protein [Clostridium gasigenes]|uniref:N-acylneuraminate cytidylyltransferase n=1 Tax=Clostridium gasigenes TaxID=94869 RepID=A0A1H0NSW4_9CLOT|nr:acylneuraminate cytidylyltransferase family protein [Clostridium gasigenes]MBU3105420.1 acylneuraminate cytidylyltransferase family protein [Clostridium gasigenes]MBU3131820.1 acylneuraminate cytidylyltransferase family protein [Clostridium gasigenes]NKF05583.1 acylneuraminate cytidylyltransferase family protein [Clostridium gasigenes]QSW19025.1 acylneuraminate cytidylyltransferase family protein [Clostridium gasigenes]SDO95771.1 N-acylneuraminate cytidylyltransferase [Clostridium gasigenes
MFKGKSFLAIIPARSGSKGLKDKNIMELDGKPLLAYTVESAMKSNIFDNIILSTNSKEYAKIGNKYGAETPFLRPNKLSEDDTSTIDVITYVLETLASVGKTYDYFILLQPTSPLRNEKNILESVDILLNNSGNAVVSICELDHPSNINTKIKSNNTLDFYDLKKVRRQDIEKEYRINGAIYICGIKYFMKYKSFYKEKCYPYIMDKASSIDIDDIYDFKYAEYSIKNTVSL